MQVKVCAQNIVSKRHSVSKNATSLALINIIKSTIIAYKTAAI